MPRLELFPFRYRDGSPASGARRATLSSGMRSPRYAEWEISGVPIRVIDLQQRWFSIEAHVPHADAGTWRVTARVQPPLLSREQFHRRPCSAVVWWL